MNIISRWIKNIVFYMLLNTVLMNLLGNSRYKKYVSIVSGLILVMIVISPLIKILHLDDELDYKIRSKEFAVETADFQNSLDIMEKNKTDLIFNEYKEKIKNQVGEIMESQGLYLVDLDISINMDSEHEDFGEITSMSILAKDTKEDLESKSLKERIEIEEVRISAINHNQDEAQSQEKIYSAEEIAIKIKLSDFYNIETENINISIERDG